MNLNKKGIRTKNSAQSLLIKIFGVAGMLVIASLLLFACTVETESNDHPTFVPLTVTLESVVTATPDVTPTISKTTPDIAPTNAPPPDYITGLHPSGDMSFSDYQDRLGWSGAINRGVGIGILISDEDWEAKQAVSLYIDGDIVTNETFVLATAGFSHYYLSWAPEIQPGLHEAHFELVTAEGDLLEYTWYFTLVEP